MKIKRFEPSCNLVTLKDGRGSIFSKANKMKELGANTKESIK